MPILLILAETYPMNIDRYAETVSVLRWLAHNFPGAPVGDRHPKHLATISVPITITQFG